MEAPKVASKRQAVTAELVSTEQNYVSFLKIICEVRCFSQHLRSKSFRCAQIERLLAAVLVQLYIDPLRAVLTKPELSTLFSNLEGTFSRPAIEAPFADSFTLRSNFGGPRAIAEGSRDEF